MGWQLRAPGWLRRGRVRLHPLEECARLAEAGGGDAEGRVWAAAIEEAARCGVASGWQVERGLILGVLPDDSPESSAAFRQRALALIAPRGERYAAHEMGRLTRWPRVWSHSLPGRERWGGGAEARAADLHGVRLANLDWLLAGPAGPAAAWGRGWGEEGLGAQWAPCARASPAGRPGRRGRQERGGRGVK